jgi:hypothetical protein
MLVYRGELVSGPAALPRLLLRELIYEKVFLGPVVVNDGTVARLINEPNGGLRMEVWARGVGWIEAPAGSMALASFMPGKMKPVSAELAARLDIPASELDDVTASEIELEKHEMSRPRKIYGFLYGTVVSELPSPRARAKLVRLVKERAWDLAASSVPPGHA